ncbi:poly-gamma-glutamate synthase PgsB [bacterium]|nr:MAG: poly-gamma-glutamate synthase PgsB [bacterium]
MEIIVIVGLVIALLIWWIYEYRLHRRRLSKIPIRVHINGSRGKSSVTRLIGAAFREAGIRTVTKTTGTNARFIYPNGEEEPIIRLGPANIKEQRWVVKRTAELGAEALVTECMAIDPELQWVLQKKYIQGNIGVITNARPDHLDAMGPTVCDVADAVSAVMPENGICFTAEFERFEWLKKNADKIDCELILAEPQSISDEEINKFSYIEHKENVALSLAVAQHLGILRETALKGMWNAEPDPGVLKIFSFQHNGQCIRFANAFAANDPESTVQVWQLLSSRFKSGEKIIIIANSRADRIQRAEQLGKLMAEQLPADLYILVGANLGAIADRMSDRGIDEEKITFIPDGNPEQIVKVATEMEGDKKFLIGIGNIGGPGHIIADYFEEKNR